MKKVLSTIAVLTMIFSFSLITGCNNNSDPDALNIYAYDLEQENIQTAYWRFYSNDDKYDIVLSSTPEVLIEESVPKSFINISISSSLIGREIDLLNPPTDIENYSLEIRVYHSVPVVTYMASLSPASTKPYVSAGGIKAGTITVKRNPVNNQFSIVANITDKDSKKVMCLYEGSPEHREIMICN